MDLKEEFEKIGSTVDEIRPVVLDLYRQKEELGKKIHLFNVISFARGMNEFLNSIDLELYNTSAIKFGHYRDYESGGNNVMFDLLDSQGKDVAPEVTDIMDEKQSDIWGKCMDLLSSNGLLNVDIELINEEFTENVMKSISLLENTENEIINLFLNNELKTVYEYHRMNDDLPSNKTVGKKSKI